MSFLRQGLKFISSTCHSLLPSSAVNTGRPTILSLLSPLYRHSLQNPYTTPPPRPERVNLFNHIGDPKKKIQLYEFTGERHDKVLFQMNWTGRYQKPRKKKKSLLEGRPALKAVVLKTLIKKPKKPNSANRKCVKVRLSTGKEALAYVPGEGHNLQEHNIVLVQGGRLQDTPGVKLTCKRGKYDLPLVKKKAV